MNPPIPSAPSDITASWLNLALAAEDTPEILDVRLDPLGEADSVSGYVVRANLTFAGTMDGPKSVIVKLPQSRDQRTPVLKQFYSREVGFYRELASSVGVAVPRAYYSDIDEETSDYVLVLEDFPGLKPGKNEPGATAAEARSAVRMMAQLHADWWMRSELEGFTFLGQESDTLERYHGIVQDQTQGFLERFGHLVAPDELAVFNALPEHFQPTVTALLDAPFTLIPRDLSLKNTLIAGTPDKPRFVLIDWQLAAIGAGARDVSFFIQNSVRADGWAAESELIREYHSELVGHGIGGYSFEQLLDDYRLSVLCDFARIIAFGSNTTGPVAEGLVRHEIEGRTGSASDLGLLRLLHG